MDTILYTYGDTTWRDLMTTYDGNWIHYDGVGNPDTDGTWDYTWRNGRELASMTNGSTTWTFTYNADGIRTKKTDGTTVYKYTYNGSTLTQLDVGSNRLFFVYDATAPTAVVFNNTTYYYVTNLQGDIIAILNGNGAKVVEYTYDAWGNILSTTGTLASTLGVLNPLRYRGYVYDTETELYYLQSRYYNPVWGRFINPDAFPSTGQGFTGNNMFAYCNNNSVNSLDVNGEDAIWIQERESARGFGHSGLLVQDKDDNWYFFYWGPVNENPSIKEFVDMISTGVPTNCVLNRVDAVLETHTTTGVQVFLRQSNSKFVVDRAELITSVTYLEGDYTDTLSYLNTLRAHASKNDYHLLFNNCVQNTWEALAISDARFRDSKCSTIPNRAYINMRQLTY